ncbi:MAG: hypothetical protein IH892_05120 [Planctomycetes bacterium]|nr:hypothetical protein [Planctomycetota bacterium]
MRCYFEKPRGTLGWNGMLHHPHLDDSYDIEEGCGQSPFIDRYLLQRTGRDRRDKRQSSRAPGHARRYTRARL